MKIFVTILVLLVVAAWLTVNVFPGQTYQFAMRSERALAGLETRSIDVQGIHFSYTDSGEGVPLVLLHGFTADKDHWTRVARFLTERFRVVAPDLPGFGDSTRDPALDYSVSSQAERLEEFVDQLGLSAFHLGGSSMGGAIAAIFAANNPDRVLSLWLLAPAGVETDEQSEMERILFFGEHHPLIPVSRQQFEDTLDFVFVERPFLPGPLRRYLTQVAVERQGLRKQIFADLLDESGQGMRFSLNTVVDGLKMPVFIVWGEGDRVLHPSGAAVLGSLLDNSVVELLPRTGHLPMLENPRQTAESFLRFQAGISSTQ